MPPPSVLGGWRLSLAHRRRALLLVIARTLRSHARLLLLLMLLLGLGRLLLLLGRLGLLLLGLRWLLLYLSYLSYLLGRPRLMPPGCSLLLRSETCSIRARVECAVSAHATLAERTMALTASPILGLDDDVLRIFGEKVEEESGIVAVAALACSCHMFHALLQPRASALKVESLAALCTRLGEDDLDSRPLGVASHLRWRGRGLTDVDLALIASDWLRPKGRLQGLVALDMWKAEPGEGGDGTPNSFGVRGVRALAAALPHLDSLTSLTLERGGEVPSTLLKGTAPSTINLSSPGPLTACMVGLLAARNPKLKRLKLGDSGTQVLPVRELCGNAPSCQKLDFSSGLWHLGKLSGLAIGAMLSTNASLVYLDLSHNFSPGMQCTCSAHAVHTQCTRSAHAVHMQCTCSAHAVYMRRDCSVHAVYMQCTCSVHAVYMQCSPTRLDHSHHFSPEPGRGAEWACSLGLALRTAASLRTLKLRFCAAARSTYPCCSGPDAAYPAAPEAHPLAQGCLGPRGSPLLLGCRREAALLPAQRHRFHRP